MVGNSHLWLLAALVKGSFVCGICSQVPVPSSWYKTTQSELGEPFCVLQLHLCSCAMGCLCFVWWGLSLVWPLLRQTLCRGRARDDPPWRSPQTQHSRTSRRNALWFLLEVIGGWLGTRLGALCLFCQSYYSGNNSHYFLWIVLLFCFYLRTLGWVDGPAVEHHSRCAWLWVHIFLQASSRLSFHSAPALLFSFSIFLGRCSFPAWQWQYLQCLSWTPRSKGHKQAGTDGVFPPQPCLPRCNEGRSPTDGT